MIGDSRVFSCCKTAMIIKIAFCAAHKLTQISLNETHLPNTVAIVGKCMVYGMTVALSIVPVGIERHIILHYLATKFLDREKQIQWPHIIHPVLITTGTVITQKVATYMPAPSHSYDYASQGRVKLFNE